MVVRFSGTKMLSLRNVRAFLRSMKLPPIAVVLTVAVGLSSSGWSRDLETVKVEELAKSTVSWDGTTLPAYPEGQPEITILRITVPPQTALPKHIHPVINAGVLIEGKLTVVAEDGKTLHLEAGDSIVELVNKQHFGKNETDETAQIIVFYVGIEGGKPITVKQGEGHGDHSHE